jgi:hypothetical protein
MHLIDLLADPPPNAVSVFLEEWYGSRVPRGPFVSTPSIPEPLAELQALAKERHGLFVQNQLLPVDELESVDGRLIFYVENQGNWVWACDQDRDDPVVWSRSNDPGGPWQAEREPLSRFLLQVVLFEGSVGAPHGAMTAMLTIDELQPVLEPMKRLDLGAWRWPAEPTWFYAGSDTIAVVNPNDGSMPAFPSTFDIVIGARSSEGLAYLETAKTRPWDSELVTITKIDPLDEATWPPDLLQ